jgi:hypothetical protein
MSKEFKHILKDYIVDPQDTKYQRRPLISYPLEAKKQLALLTARKTDEVDIFGSYIYRNQLYAADIDIFEIYKGKHDLSTIAKQFYQSFKKIVQRVLSTPLEYYSEVKCGVDERFDIDIGTCSEGIYSVSRSINDKLANLLARGLLYNDDYNQLASILLKTNKDGDDYDIVSSIIRKYYIIRWEAKEVLQGWKLLIGDIKFYFVEGLKMNSLVKIDTWSYLNNKLLEVTNVYFLSYVKDGKSIDIQSHNDPSTLKADIEKLYYSNLYYSPFKMVKRIYAYLRQVKNQEGDNFDPSLERLLDRITGVVATLVSSLYQNKHEIDTTILVLEKYGESAITDQLIIATDKIKSRLAGIGFLSDDCLLRWCEMIDSVNSRSTLPHKLDLLNTISTEMKYVISYKTIEDLNEFVLNPPNRVLLPDHLTYDTKIIRRPDSFIVNPLEKAKLHLKGGGPIDDLYRALRYRTQSEGQKAYQLGKVYGPYKVLL